MKQTYLATLALSFTLTTAAWAETTKHHSETNVERKENGEYHASVTSENTDAAGTTHKEKITQEAGKTLGGDQKVTTESKQVTDPKGLMNKHSASQKVVSKTDEAGNLKKDSIAKSVDAAGTAHKSEIDVEKKINADGSVEQTTTETKVTDPKGLMNKSKTETEKAIKHNNNGTTTTKIEKKVDGDVVQDTTHTTED